MNDLKMMTNKEHIQSMDTVALAQYLTRINDNGFSVEQIIDWLNSVYVCDRIKPVILGKKYTGDFEGEAATWDEAYKKEIIWLSHHGYLGQDSVDTQGKGDLL